MRTTLLFFAEMASSTTAEQLLVSDNNTDFTDIKQSFSLLRHSLRFLLTVACVTFLLAILKIFHDKGSLSRTQVNVFNVISTALVLMLSLAFFVSKLNHVSLSGARMTKPDRIVGCFQGSRQRMEVENIEDEQLGQDRNTANP